MIVFEPPITAHSLNGHGIHTKNILTCINEYGFHAERIYEWGIFLTQTTLQYPINYKKFLP